VLLLKDEAEVEPEEEKGDDDEDAPPPAAEVLPQEIIARLVKRPEDLSHRVVNYLRDYADEVGREYNVSNHLRKQNM